MPNAYIGSSLPHFWEATIRKGKGTRVGSPWHFHSTFPQEQEKIIIKSLIFITFRFCSKWLVEKSTVKILSKCFIRSQFLFFEIRFSRSRNNASRKTWKRFWRNKNSAHFMTHRCHRTTTNRSLSNRIDAIAAELQSSPLSHDARLWQPPSLPDGPTGVGSFRTGGLNQETEWEGERVNDSVAPAGEITTPLAIMMRSTVDDSIKKRS